MGKLDAFKIKKSPEAFAAFCGSHNAFVGLVEAMKGGPGLVVTPTNTNIVISFSVDKRGIAQGMTVQNAVFAQELHYLSPFAKVDIDGQGIRIYNLANGKSLQINTGDITQNIGIQTLTVCDSGTPKQMLVLGSAPF